MGPLLGGRWSGTRWEECGPSPEPFHSVSAGVPISAPPEEHSRLTWGAASPPTTGASSAGQGQGAWAWALEGGELHSSP